MGSIRVSPETLLREARAYERASRAIEQAIVDIQATNERMARHWNGAAFRGFLAQYEQVLNPAILDYNRIILECHRQVKNYAETIRARDQQDHHASRHSRISINRNSVTQRVSALETASDRFEGGMQTTVNGRSTISAKQNARSVFEEAQAGHRLFSEALRTSATKIQEISDRFSDLDRQAGHIMNERRS